ncbi:MAG: hypothetical protein AAFU64_16615 [Bacteroidota bacterium]
MHKRIHTLHTYAIMKKKSFTCLVFLPFILITLLPSLIRAQNTNCDATSLDAFFSCYGGREAFSPHSVDAITTFIQAEDALKAENYAQAKSLIDNLFNAYPTGTNQWWNIFNDPNGWFRWGKH